ncbi:MULTISPECIES: hypothetical protein [Staphylococcus]|uniref:Uncharacterized protein n=1 Tax=Staphylococcus ureilyticus TaxID=94138 RepID=A0AB34AF96_STAUR|nr:MULTISPECIES: hypothetical protein [Staphylococcus]KKD22566.1 hypothetical protein XA21_10150 [Staphylococcus cohnii subsp. cohnii]PIS60904.1 hypothetical protein AZH47_10940 [Corynebacterium striatum]AQM40476.1 hypothetical protein BZ166_01345 [Staphylococcus cohnii]KKD25744.1 hypothetical protein XA22_05630 [Staphylococcus cohnii subsp. cohnii]MBL0377369.1 hypothetical protein [Staphylococcus sp. S75]
MKLTYLPKWQIINQSQKNFMIQEDTTSISLVSPINEYAMGILSQIYFTIEQGNVVNTTIENNSDELKVTVDEENLTLYIFDL